MNKLFYIQLITSFIVGGGVITLLSFIAEKANKQIAGIILVFPSTIALVFPYYGFIIGTFLAYGVSLLVTLLLIKFQPKTN